MPEVAAPVLDPAWTSSRFRRNSAWIFGAGLLGKLAMWGLLALAARRWGPAGFGAFTFAMACAGILRTLLEGGISLQVARGVAQDPEGAGTLLAAAQALRLAIALGLLPVGLGVLAVFHPPIETGVLLLVFPAAMFFEVDAQLQYAVCSGFGRMDWEGRLGVLRALLIVGGGIALILGGRGPVAVALCYAAAALAVSLLARRVVRHRFLPPQRQKASRAGMGLLVRGGVSLSGAAFLGTLAYYAGIFLIRRERGDASLGLYQAALATLAELHLLPSAVSAALLPILARHQRFHRGALLSRWLRSLALLGVLGFLMAGALHALAPVLLPLAFGPAFLPAVPVFRILVWSLPIVFMTYPTGSAMVALGGERRMLRHAAAVLAFSVAAAAWGVFQWGLAGAALACLATETFQLALNAGYVRRRILEGVPA